MVFSFRSGSQAGRIRLLWPIHSRALIRACSTLRCLKPISCHEPLIFTSNLYVTADSPLLCSIRAKLISQSFGTLLIPLTRERSSGHNVALKLSRALPSAP